MRHLLNVTFLMLSSYPLLLPPYLPLSPSSPSLPLPLFPPLSVPLPLPLLSSPSQKLLLAARPPLTPSMVKVAYPASTNPADYEQYFTDRTPAEQSVSVFATLPAAAGNLWKAAARLVSRNLALRRLF